MKKTFTILVSLLVTACVYSQTYNVNTFYAELGGYVIKNDSGWFKTDGTHGVVVAMQDQGLSYWPEATVMVKDASKHDANGAKFNDWRLPTKDELNLMYWQRGEIGGFSPNYYFSSTESDNGSAWVWGQYFGDGGQSENYKGNLKMVRAVRAF